MASASASASRVADAFVSIATQLRAISKPAWSISESASRISHSIRNDSSAAPLVDNTFLLRPPPPSAAVAEAAAGSNPRNETGFGEVFSPRRVTELCSSKVEFGTVPFRICSVGFSSRLHGWGAPANVPQLMAGGLSGGGVGQQMRRIFVEVKGNDLDRAIRKWRRKCKEENLKILKDREYFRKPSEKRVLALKERDRRIARRSFKMKLNWILGRRQRGF